MFLDTSCLLNFFNMNEAQHSRASLLFAGANVKLTHSYVLAEFTTLAYQRGLPRSAALEFVHRLLNAPRVQTIWVDESLHRRGLALLEARPDKAYSLCDAISFVLMRERSITDALTTDHHFDQEGFTRLLML